MSVPEIRFDAVHERDMDLLFAMRCVAMRAL